MGITKKLLYKILYRIRCIKLYIYWKSYGFDKWHIGNNIYNRPYKLQLAKLLSSLELESIIEVGCGFGEILECTNAITKIGYDNDPKVIAAASKATRRVSFKVGSLNDIKEESFDCLLLFNWIHNLSEKELEQGINKYWSKISYLVVDQVKKGTSGYKYHHTFDFLKSRYELIKNVEAEKDVRNILVFKAISSE